MTKVKGTLHVSIDFSCPKCDAYLDAFDEDETGIMNDEGQLWEIITGWRGRKGKGWKNLNEEAKCGKCGHEFIWDELEY